MTAVDLPLTGPADWTNFVSYWREEDAEWLQARTVLRVDTPAQLGTLITAPSPGQVVYVKDVTGGQKDVLFLFASATSSWIPYPALPKFLYASEDSAARVTFGHHTGDPTTVVPSVTLSPTGIDIPADLTVRTDKLKVTAADVQIKIGTKLVKLTTDAVGLVSDSPISAPSLTTSGAITAGGAITGPSLSVPTVTVTTLNVTTVTASGNISTPGSVSAASHVSLGGTFTGDASGAIVQGPGATAKVLVQASDVSLQGTNTNVDSQLKVNGGRSINFYNASNALLGYGGPVIFSATDPGAANCPNGTIWVS